MFQKTASSDGFEYQRQKCSLRNLDFAIHRKSSKAQIIAMIFSPKQKEVPCFAPNQATSKSRLRYIHLSSFEPTEIPPIKEVKKYTSVMYGMPINCDRVDIIAEMASTFARLYFGANIIEFRRRID